jgi:pimeloyl-ACP methyl ester carboxylesterase
MKEAMKPTTFRGEQLELDDHIRESLPGSFIRVSQGVTHYELAGPVYGPPVVFIPGFSVPYYLWDPPFDFLVGQGFRALRYDLFGRGYSDRPQAEYNADLFDRQLEDLLTALEIRLPVDLVGSSMGGILAVHFADRHPEKVRKLVLVDPAGLLDGLGFPKSLLCIPFQGELLMDWLGTPMLVSGNRGDFFEPDAHPEYITQFQPQLQFRGFKQAVLSTLRSGILCGQEDVFGRVGRQRRPTLVIWGREDQVIPFAISQQVLAHLPGADFVVVEQAGHVPHYERPEIVNPILLNFLKSPC